METLSKNYLQLNNRKVIVITAVLVLAFVVLTILQDLSEARFRNRSFYLSESFMFSSFWWLFVPVMYGQYVFAKQKKPAPLSLKIALICIPFFLHLFAFPGLVWVISKLFYYHTFRYSQTFQYTVAEYLYLLLFFYSVPVGMYFLLRAKKTSANANIFEKSETVSADTIPAAVYVTPPAPTVTSFIVAEGTRRVQIAIVDIMYITAQPPYVSLQTAGKKYLHSASLKSMLDQVEPGPLVRIHKSAIVNIDKVRAYTSRQNGDYDLTMKDGQELRVSRNYAAAFKAAFAVKSSG
ncbi:MAG: LytTR family DNA-binding domain-containing protein [Bacteroidota bacterium]